MAKKLNLKIVATATDADTGEVFQEVTATNPGVSIDDFEKMEEVISEGLAKLREYKAKQRGPK